MHLEALRILLLLTSFFTGLPDIFPAMDFDACGFALSFMLQFLLVQWPFTIIEPKLQNSANKITPLYV